MATKRLGEPERSVSTDVFIGDAPRGLSREENELSLRPETMWQRQRGCKPEGGIGVPCLLAGLVGGMVGGVEVCARRQGELPSLTGSGAL